MPTETIAQPAPSPNAAQTQTTPNPTSGMQSQADDDVSKQVSQDSGAGADSGSTGKTSDPMREVWAKPVAAPKKEAAPTTGAKAKPAEAADKPGEKKADAPADKPGDKKVVAGAKKPEGDNSVITQIRNAEKAAKNEAAEWRGKYEQLQKNGNGDSAALTTTLAEKDKRIAQLESEVGTLNYRKNPEFIKNFDAPFQSAQKTAKNVIESLKVITGKDAEDKDIVRRAEWSKDFLPLTRNLTGENTAEIRANAIDEIEAKFGKYSDQAMAQWNKLFELRERREEAANEYSQKNGEIEAQARSKQIQQKENFTKAFEMAHKDLLEQNQELFGERPDDPDGNALLKKMDTLIDPVFHAPETLAPEEFVARLAAIKHRVRNFPRLQRDLSVANDRISELEARINGGEESVNGLTRKSGEQIESTDPEQQVKQEMQKAWS